MNTKTLMLSACALIAAYAFAEDISVADGYALELTGNDKITVATPTFQVDGKYPSDAPQPYFWFDASDTNGWGFTTYDKQTCVSNIPSKAGSKLAGKRYLSTEANVATTYTSNDGDEWYGWWKTETKTQEYPDDLFLMRPPVYVASESTLGKQPCLDFLTFGARRALRFNNYVDAGCMVASNALRGIGTVVAVYGSQNGGGWFLGGGGDGSSIRWHRNTLDACDQNSENNWMNPILREMGNAWAYNGRVRHDGYPQGAGETGYNHGWEVLGWQFTSASGMTFGPGIGDGRGYGWQRSGGQKIAEMIFFDSVLTDTQIEKVEAYLQKKWFNRTFPGRNDAARLAYLSTTTTSGYGKTATGVTTELAVADGKSLAVDRVVGGYGDDTRIKKTGAGTLSLGKAYAFGGTVELAGGTLDYPALRPIPAADELPRDCWMHFDPSDTDSLKTNMEDGVVWLRSLKNLSGNRKYYSKAWHDVWLSNYESRRCEVKMDELGAGLNVIDLGFFSQDSDKARYLLFTGDGCCETNAPNGEISMYGVTTMIAVYSARGAGGHLGNSRMFERYVRARDNYQGWAKLGGLSPMNDSGSAKLAGTNGVLYIDGERVDPGADGRVKNAGFQIVAVQTAGGNVNRLGMAYSTGAQNMGGLMLGEIFLYRRPLSEQEIKDVSAYLAKKWLNIENTGYTSTGARTRTAADIGKVAASASTDVAVVDGRTVRFGALTGAAGATLAKKGAGTLEAESAQVSGTLAVREGELKVTGPLATTTASGIAADPYAWFDPTDRQRMLVETVDSAERVKVWYDKGLEHTLATHSGARRPTIRQDEVSGNDYLDFGVYGKDSSTFLVFEKAVESARSVYVIWRTKDNTQLAQMFGSMGYGGYESVENQPTAIECLRGEDKVGNEYKLFRDNSYSPFAFGDIYTNGVKVTRNAIPTTNAFELIEVHMKKPAHFAALANDRTLSRYGGSDFGDVIIYDRVLTEREKVATRNYLMKKWFNREPEALPAAADAANTVAELVVADGAAATFAANASVGNLAGAGQVNVAAGKTLALAASDAANTVAVDLAAGAKLDLGGKEVYVNRVTGSGSVTNGTVTMATFTASQGEAKLVVDGTLKVAANAQVTVTDYEEGVTEYNIATANDVEGRANFASATITGVPASGMYRLCARKEGGKRVLKVAVVRGTLIIVK